MTALFAPEFGSWLLELHESFMRLAGATNHGLGLESTTNSALGTMDSPPGSSGPEPSFMPPDPMQPSLPRVTVPAQHQIPEGGPFAEACAPASENLSDLAPGAARRPQPRVAEAEQAGAVPAPGLDDSAAGPPARPQRTAAEEMRATAALVREHGIAELSGALRDRMNALKISAAKVAQRGGVSESSMSYAYRGLRGLTNVRMLERLHGVLDEIERERRLTKSAPPRIAPQSGRSPTWGHGDQRVRRSPNPPGGAHEQEQGAHAAGA